MKKNYITRTIQLGSYEVMGINLETTEVSKTFMSFPAISALKTL